MIKNINTVMTDSGANGFLTPIDKYIIKNNLIPYEKMNASQKEQVELYTQNEELAKEKAKEQQQWIDEGMPRNDTFDHLAKALVPGVEMTENIISSIKGEKGLFDGIINQIDKIGGAINGDNSIFEVIKEIPIVKEIVGAINGETKTPENAEEIKETMKVNETGSLVPKDIENQLSLVPKETEVSGNSDSQEEIQKSQDWEEFLNKLWAREDKIRKETQNREDSAYQRAVADMRKAGINPNLVGISPAESGGGITNATGAELKTEEMAEVIKMMINEINNAKDISENEKDRNIRTVQTMGALAMLAMRFLI